MTDNDIIKALECCIGDTEGRNCFDCPLYEIVDCQPQMYFDVLDLINRQKAEIERLQGAVAMYEEERKYHFEMSRKKTAEAITEFAERLKKEAEYVSIDSEGDFVFFCKGNDFEMYYTVSEWLAKASDQIAKEMKGEQ